MRLQFGDDLIVVVSLNGIALEQGDDQTVQVDEEGDQIVQEVDEHVSHVPPELVLVMDFRGIIHSQITLAHAQVLVQQVYQQREREGGEHPLAVAQEEDGEQTVGDQFGGHEEVQLGTALERVQIITFQIG